MELMLKFAERRIARSATRRTGRSRGRCGSHRAVAERAIEIFAPVEREINALRTRPRERFLDEHLPDPVAPAPLSRHLAEVRLDLAVGEQLCEADHLAAIDSYRGDDPWPGQRAGSSHRVSREGEPSLGLAEPQNARQVLKAT